MKRNGTPIVELRQATFIERYWTWGSREDTWVRNERRTGPLLQYRFVPGGAWHNVPSVEVVTSDPPKPPDD